MPITDLCAHPDYEGCYHCCGICNIDRHMCPGCGASVAHGESVCPDCKKEHGIS